MKDRIKEALQSARDKNKGKITPSKDIYESIYRAGIQEVVDWLKKEAGIPASKTIEELNKGHCFIPIERSKWEAMINKWGVK